MATSVPGSDSPVQEPFIFFDGWDEPFAQWTGDEFPSLFGDLPDGPDRDLNVGDAPSNIFDDFPIGPDLDVGIGPSNLFDDFLNGVDMPLGVGPSTLLDDFPIGVDVNVGGEPLNLIDDFPMGLDVNVHDGPEFSADYQDALTYDTGALSVPAVTDPHLLRCMEYTDKHLLQLSDLEGTGPIVLQDQLGSFTNFEPQPSWSTQMDGTTLSPFEYGTIFGLQTDVCNDLAMPENCENAADIFAAPNSLTVVSSSTTFDPSHADITDDHLIQSAGLAGLTSPTSLFDHNMIRSDRDPMLGNPMGTISALEDTRSTQELALKDNAFSSDEKERHQPHLGWISYDQSSFTENTIVPKPIYTCNLPDNRKRGRREPLSESKRSKVAEMRQLKSCLLCRMRKKNCDNGTPCKRCLDAARSRPSLLPCLRAPLADLTAAFVPSIPFLNLKLRYPRPSPDTQIWRHWLTCLPSGLSYMDFNDETMFSSAQEALNVWAENATNESITEADLAYCLASAQVMRVLKVISRVFIDRARPPVVKDALKILLLMYLLNHPYYSIQGTYASGKKSKGSVPAGNGITIQSCVLSLIEKTLSKLLPRLQALLLQRYCTDWAVIVSAMTVLSMTGNKWTQCNSDQDLEGGSSTIEDGWNVLLGLYRAAYGGYYLLPANSAKLSRISHSDETASILLNELKIWVEHDGDHLRCWDNYPWKHTRLPKKLRIHIIHMFDCVARLISDQDAHAKYPSISSLRYNHNQRISTVHILKPPS